MPDNASIGDMITDEELKSRAAKILGGSIADKSVTELRHLITVTQYLTDLILNELEDRGEELVHDGHIVVPYHAELMLETILTGRGDPLQ